MEQTGQLPTQKFELWKKVMGAAVETRGNKKNMSRGVRGVGGDEDDQGKQDNDNHSWTL